VLIESVEYLKLFSQILVNILRSLGDPRAAYDVRYRRSSFRVGVEASVEEIKDLLRMCLIDFPEGTVDLAVERMLAAGTMVHLIEVISCYLSEGETLDHYHQKGHS
jgi:hypothetical protein